jgi:hypothetical protein
MVASEITRGLPLADYLLLHGVHKLHFQKEPLLASNGLSTLPGEPGFGMEFDEQIEKNREII